MTEDARRRRRQERTDASVDDAPRRGRRRSQPPDAAPNDDPAANLDEVLSAVSEEENASSEGDSEPEGHDIGVVDEPWNTPSGFEKVKEQSSEYFKRIKYHGHVCSVCGERRFDGKDIPAAKIRKWGVGRTKNGDLTQVLYPQYPLAEQVPVVCDSLIDRCIVIDRWRSTGCAVVVRMKVVGCSRAGNLKPISRS